MRVTKNQLRRIIREEKRKVLAENRVRRAVRQASRTVQHDSFRRSQPVSRPGPPAGSPSRRRLARRGSRGEPGQESAREKNRIVQYAKSLRKKLWEVVDRESFEELFLKFAEVFKSDLGLMTNEGFFDSVIQHSLFFLSFIEIHPIREKTMMLTFCFRSCCA